MCEKMVGLVKAGRDGVAGLLELRNAMKHTAQSLKFPEETEPVDANAYMNYLNELLDVLDNGKFQGFTG